MRSMRWAGLLFFLVLSFCGGMAAQQLGTPEFHEALRSQIDSLYSANLDVQLEHTVISKPGRGIPFYLKRVYHSSVILEGGGYFSYAASGGWSDVTSAGAISWAKRTISCTYYDRTIHRSFKEPYTWWSGFAFLDPSGVQYSFPLSLHDGNDCESTQLSGTAKSGPYTMHADATSGIISVTVSGPGGRVYSGPASVEDSNGNYLSTSTPSGSETDYTDTTGQVVLKEVTSTSGCVNPVDGVTYPKCVSYSSPNGDGSGGWSAYTEYYQTINVATSSGCSGITDYTGTATVPVYGVLPQYPSDSSAYYKFGYDGAGRLNHIRFPQGGSATYTYGSLCTFGDGTPASVTRVDNDNNGNTASTTTYTRTSTSTTMTRPDGSKEVVTYNSSGLPTDISSFDTNGTTLLAERTISYDANGYPSTTIDYRNGVQVRKLGTAYDTYGNLYYEIDYDLARDSSLHTCRITNTVYDTDSTYINHGLWDLPTSIKVSDCGGTYLSQTTIQYDQGTLATASAAQHDDTGFPASFTTRGNPTTVSRVTGSGSLTTSFTYDTAGNLLSSTGPNGNVVTRSYGAGSCGAAYPTSVSAPGGAVSDAWDCLRGNRTSVTDANNQTTSFTYDAYGRLTRVARPDGGWTTTGYPNSNTTVVTTAVDGGQNRVSETITDGFGQTIYSAGQAPSGWDIVATKYDGMGRPVQTSIPYNSSSISAPSNAVLSTRSYDGLGRVLSLKAPDGSVTSYAYDQTAVQITDPKGVVKIEQYDGLGHLWKVCEVSSQAGSSACGTTLGGGGFLTTYTYDMAGRLTSVQQGTQSRTWSYDELGRALSHTDPESGTTNYTYDSVTDGTCPSGSSQSAGDLVLVADASGMKTCLKYDPWHRVTAKTQYVDSTHTYQYSYAWDGTESNGKGRMASATSPWATDSFAYDALGRPTTATEALSGFGSSPSTAYTYNYLGEVVSETAPSNRRFGRSYNGEGRLTRLYDLSNNYSFLWNRSFDAAGDLTGQSFSPSVMQMTASYNDRLQPYKFTYTAPNNNTMTLLYHWGAQIDASGNVTSTDNNGTLRELEVALPGNASGKTMNYSYDDMGRLATATEGDGALNVGFTLDSYGNRNRQDPYNGSGLQEVFPSAPATNRIQGFTYDAAGRVLAGSWAGASRSFAWDPDGKLLAYSDSVNGSASYGYDAFGRRVLVSQGGVTTWYFYGAGTGAHPLAEYTASSLWQTNFEADGKVWGSIQNNGTVEYYGLSALGTARLNVDGGTNAVSTGTVYPYGEDGVALNTEYRFTNQRRDPNGIDHFWMRSYAAPLGRWLTPDPAGLAAVDPNDPQSWNRYAYVANHPLALADPFGLADGDLSYCGTSAGTVTCKASITVTGTAPGTDNGFDPPYTYIGPNNSPAGGGTAATRTLRSRLRCAVDWTDAHGPTSGIGRLLAGNVVAEVMDLALRATEPGADRAAVSATVLGDGVTNAIVDPAKEAALNRSGAAIVSGIAKLQEAGQITTLGLETTIEQSAPEILALAGREAAGPIGLAMAAYGAAQFAYALFEKCK